MFVHLGALLVLSWWFQLCFLEFWGLFLKINIRTFLASLRRDNGLLKDLVMTTNRRQLRGGCFRGHRFNSKWPLGQFTPSALRPSCSFTLSPPPPFHVLKIWQRRAEQCETVRSRKEREREREGQGEEEKRQGSQCETSYREREGKNRQCEVIQTYPRTESEDAIVLSQNGYLTWLPKHIRHLNSL